ncbi:MAG: undecaprenyldiphospho-muramoylpentapeptide beta-N-acetylglucosaminyltransferase [Holosporales bacterium]|jgi:UDP-N-acetylglucosamine--N-acetylmuramyl-(pentapeptide) pyrophosphoryl-undecaprenol N-acetylglucosamine transferase|nr:undecaprenyldiphospho-muramoylpentapeptide beta-N-acetylglucosaminyltransferase [Holosporales bacterium]
MSDKVIAIVAGGTGGHVFPAVSVFQELKARKQKVLFITDQRAERFCADISNDDLIVMKTIRVPKQLDQIAKNFSKLLKNIKIVKQMLALENIALFVGFGGLFSLVPLIYSYLKKVPFIIHEQNAVMGVSNRLLSRLAHQVFLSYPNTKYATKNASVLGLPIRKAFLDLVDNQSPKQEPKDKFEICVIGGSQGAKIFAEEMPQSLDALPQALKEKINLIQQARAEDVQDLEERVKKAGIEAEVRPFIMDSAYVLSNTDLVICRAGASTIAEVATLGRPAIIIPFAQAKDNHQVANAKAYVQNGCGWLLTEEQFRKGELTKLVEYLMEHPQELSKASDNMKKNRKLDATCLISDKICQDFL